MEKTWKQVINSAYGYWGLKWQQKRGCSLMNDQQLDVAFEQGKVYNYNQIGDMYMVDSEKDLDEIKGRSIAIASAVTSFARMELYSVMKAV